MQKVASAAQRRSKKGEDCRVSRYFFRDEKIDKRGSCTQYGSCSVFGLSQSRSDKWPSNGRSYPPTKKLKLVADGRRRPFAALDPAGGDTAAHRNPLQPPRKTPINTAPHSGMGAISDARPKVTKSTKSINISSPRHRVWTHEHVDERHNTRFGRLHKHSKVRKNTYISPATKIVLKHALFD